MGRLVAPSQSGKPSTIRAPSRAGPIATGRQRRSNPRVRRQGPRTALTPSGPPRLGRQTQHAAAPGRPSPRSSLRSVPLARVAPLCRLSSLPSLVSKPLVVPPLEAMEVAAAVTPSSPSALRSRRQRLLTSPLPAAQRASSPASRPAQLSARPRRAEQLGRSSPRPEGRLGSSRQPARPFASQVPSSPRAAPCGNRNLLRNLVEVAESSPT